MKVSNIPYLIEKLTKLEAFLERIRAYIALRKKELNLDDMPAWIADVEINDERYSNFTIRIYANEQVISSNPGQVRILNEIYQQLGMMIDVYDVQFEGIQKENYHFQLEFEVYIR